MPELVFAKTIFDKIDMAIYYIAPIWFPKLTLASHIAFCVRRMPDHFVIKWALVRAH